jgi:hypothetical protein
MLSKALSLCVQIGISLDELLDVHGRVQGCFESIPERLGAACTARGAGVACGNCTGDKPSVMTFLPSLMLNKGIRFRGDVVGQRMFTHDLPDDVCAALGQTRDELGAGWCFGRSEAQGIVRIFISAKLERDFPNSFTFARVLEKLKKQGTAYDILVAPEEIVRVSHAIGIQIRMYEELDSAPPATSLRTVLIRPGIATTERIRVQMHCVLRISGPTSGTMLFWLQKSTDADRQLGFDEQLAKISDSDPIDKAIVSLFSGDTTG